MERPYPVSMWARKLRLKQSNFLPGHMWHLSVIFTSSHFTPSEGGGERWPELLLCDAGGDGEGHQGEPLFGAWRVRCQPLWHQDRLYPWSGGCRPHLHPGCQPPGLSKAHTPTIYIFFCPNALLWHYLFCLGPESVEDCWVYAICGVYCCSWTGHTKSYAQSCGRCWTYDQATHGTFQRGSKFFCTHKLWWWWWWW